MSTSPTAALAILEMAADLKMTGPEGTTVKSCFSNAKLIAEKVLGPRLRFNLLTNEIWCRGEPFKLGAPDGPWRHMDEFEVIHARAWFESTFEISLSKADCADLLLIAARASCFHPVRDYLNGLPAWDGVNRLGNWLHEIFGATDDAPTREVAECFLISAVARAFGPCKVDTCLVLESPQGWKKSSGLKALFGGDAFFSDTEIDLASKDAYISIHRVWCFEFGELNGVSKADARRVKGFLSSSHDVFRPPYGKVAASVPRGNVFVATTNQKEGFLTDRSGNRRFWVIPISEKADLEKIAGCRDVLWAEALARFKAGQKWWLGDESAAALEAVASERTTQDLWVELIRKNFPTLPNSPKHITFEQAIGLLELGAFETAGTFPQKDVTRLGEALHAAGFTRKQKRDGKRMVRVYEAPRALLKRDTRPPTKISSIAG